MFRALRVIGCWMRKLGLTGWVFRAAGSVFRAEGPPHRIWDMGYMGILL